MNRPIRYSLVVFLGLFLLSACGSGIPVVLWPRAITVTIADRTSEEYRARQAGKRALRRLVQKQDVQGSARCLLGECSWAHTWGTYPDSEKLILTSSQTVIDRWGAQPENVTEVIAVMQAYVYLARNVRTKNPEQARQYRLKGLSYLQNDAITHLYNIANFTVFNEKAASESLTSVTMRLLQGLVKRDFEQMQCTYPAEIKSYIANGKFSEEDVQRLLKLSCWNSDQKIKYEKFTIVWEA